MHRLHDGGSAGRRRNYRWRSHRVGHRLHGRLRHWAMHGDQYWLVVEGGACQKEQKEAGMNNAHRLGVASGFFFYSE